MGSSPSCVSIAECQEGEFLVCPTGATPCALPLLRPSVYPIANIPAKSNGEASDGAVEGAGGTKACESTRSNGVRSEAVSAILRASVASISKWYLEMRDIVSRGRAAQCAYREENRLPKHAKVPWVKPEITLVNQAVASAMSIVVSSIYGQELSKYAEERFWHAAEFGDMRSFKIRLIFLKARDSLRKSPFYEEFCSGLEDAITEAENLAGCVPDPSARRMSRAEQEAAARRKKESKEDGGNECNGYVTVTQDSKPDKKDIIPKKKKHTESSKNSLKLDDDKILELMKCGTISPEDALMIMMSNDPKIDKNQIDISQRKLSRVMKRLQNVTVTKNCSNPPALTKDDIDALADDISKLEYGNCRDDDECAEEDDDMDGEDMEDQVDPEVSEEDEVDVEDEGSEIDRESDCHPRYYGRQCVGGWHHYAGYGRYNSSGSEWNPDDGA